MSLDLKHYPRGGAFEFDPTTVYDQTERYDKPSGLWVSVNWPLIATRWDGIIIAPYQWSCRYDDRTFWYYGWDCASGCIWNLHAITDVIAPSVEVAA